MIPLPESADVPQRVRDDYERSDPDLPCDERGCGHLASQHPLPDDDEFPEALRSCPCTVPGCGCTDYDGMLHPQRPSLADVVIYRPGEADVI